MSDPDSAPTPASEADRLAAEISAAGEALALPFIAVSADIASTEPMRDSADRPYAETLFRWIDPKLEYWKDRAFALRSAMVHATRTCAEPFYFSQGKLGSWRSNKALEASHDPEQYELANVRAAIVAPVHLPGGVIGAVVWASDEAIDAAARFATHAERLHALALKFIATYHDARELAPKGPAVHLTRREIQCLKWAAAGKTDSEIATIMDISVPTVRFHITNSASKMGVSGKARAIQRATILGYISNE